MGVGDIVERGAVELGIRLPPGAGAAFEKYYDLLEQRGKYCNLTAISGEEDVAKAHFIDSLAMLKYTGFKDASVVDVGSGAGFPGMPIKIAEPSAKLTFLDAARKRVLFLSDLCSALDVEARCVQARAEEAARTVDMREMFDIAMSRAVAKLNILCEMCLPLTRVGGVFLAMKGAGDGAAQELVEAHGAIKILGAEVIGAMDYRIPGTEIAHRVIVVRKNTKTPDEYPRRFAKMHRSPL